MTHRGLTAYKVLLALLALLALAPTSLMAAAPTLPGAGFEVEGYQLQLRPDLSTTALSGVQRIRLRSTSDHLTQLTFSPNALQILSAELNGQPIAVTSTTDGITFALPSALAKGARASLAFKIVGVPAQGVVRAASGFYTSYFACDWMVCLQDSPGQKASFALDLFVPAGIDTLSIGAGLPQKVLPNGLVLHRWRATRPYSAYLFGFAVGTFSQQSSKTTAGTFVYLDGTGRGADLADAFQQTPSIAAFFAQAAGVSLPDGRYTQLLVPGQEAQEAATFSLIGVQALQDEQEDPASSWIIAHEMAHQWWGNLVTCASWQDFWLNEGITTFMVAAWKQHAFGEAAYQQELDEARRRLAIAREAGFDKPLAWSGEYPSLRMRRAVQYSKGALFMAHLRQTLGEQAFLGGHAPLHPQECGRDRRQSGSSESNGARQQARSFSTVRTVGVWRRSDQLTTASQNHQDHMLRSMAMRGTA